MVFHWSLGDSKSPQVSRTLLSILAVLNNVVVWMVSTRPSNSMSSSLLNNPLVTVPNAPVTIGIIVTFMFHSFFNSRARSRYLSFFTHSFSFILWSAGVYVCYVCLCVIFSDRCWVVHIPFVCMVKFKLLHISQWITLPTQSCLVLYSFCANLLHSLLMRLIIIIIIIIFDF